MRLRRLLPVDTRVGEGRRLGARSGEGGGAGEAMEWVPHVEGEGVEDVGSSPGAEETWNQRHCYVGFQFSVEYERTGKLYIYIGGFLVIGMFAMVHDECALCFANKKNKEEEMFRGFWGMFRHEMASWTW